MVMVCRAVRVVRVVRIVMVLRVVMVFRLVLSMQKCITIVMYLILFSTYDLTVYNFLPVFFQCQKNEHFRKHMLLLWQNNVPMCVEVLMSPECRTEPVRSSLAVTTTAEPGSLLLEQWTVAVLPASTSSGSLMTSLALLQAVRSYLHFSQVTFQHDHVN